HSDVVAGSSTSFMAPGHCATVRAKVPARPQSRVPAKAPGAGGAADVTASSRTERHISPRFALRRTRVRNGRVVLRSLLGPQHQEFGRSLGRSQWRPNAECRRSKSGKPVATWGVAGVRARGLEPPRAFAHQD